MEMCTHVSRKCKVYFPSAVHEIITSMLNDCNCKSTIQLFNSIFFNNAFIKIVENIKKQIINSQ